MEEKIGEESVREGDLRVGGAREDLGEDEEDVPLGKRVNGAHHEVRTVPCRTTFESMSNKDRKKE